MVKNEALKSQICPKSGSQFYLFIKPGTNISGTQVLQMTGPIKIMELFLIVLIMIMQMNNQLLVNVHLQYQHSN